jgi:hypothetical protein
MQTMKFAYVSTAANICKVLTCPDFFISHNSSSILRSTTLHQPSPRGGPSSKPIIITLRPTVTLPSFQLALNIAAFSNFKERSPVQVTVNADGPNLQVVAGREVVDVLPPSQFLAYYIENSSPRQNDYVGEPCLTAQAASMN